MQRILVLRGGALGDFIVTLPALALLRSRWPAAAIELAGNATAAALAYKRGLLDAVYSQHESRWSRLFGPEPLPPDFAAWLAGFDLVVSYWPDPDGALARHFPRRPDQIFLSAAAQPALAPAAAHYCTPLQALGLATTKHFFRLAPEALRTSTTNLAPLAPILIHPGSGSPRKNWSVENWLELIARTREPVSLILGEAEMARWGPLADTITRQRHMATRQPAGNFGLHLINAPIEDLIFHFARCQMFLGHDSGVSHLAAACGAPCVLLFGPTDPQTWAPPVPGVRVLQDGPDLAAISVETVERAMAAARLDRA